MAITIRIPQNYAVRIVDKIKNIPGGEWDPTAIERLNIQPDGSILVQTSADNEYAAVKEVFDQNLGIPFAAIRGFDSRITSKSETGVSSEDIFGPNKSVLETQPQDIAAPITGAGDFQDLSVQEQISPGKIIEGPSLTPFAPAQVLTPSFYRDQLAAAQLDEGQGEVSSIAGLFDVAPDSVAAAAGVPPTLPAPPFVPATPNLVTGEEGLGGERSIDEVTGEVRDSAIGDNTRSQTLQEVLQAQRESDRLALEQLGEFTPFDIPQDDTGMGGNTNTSIQEMLNIFNQDPERYYTTETIIGPDGQAITQQVLSPVAQAALQAFSTQRGAEAMETGSRFGAGSPFGVIAGTGGSAQQAIDLAEQQAYSGINSPFAALQTGAGINNISQILRGGLSAAQQSDLAGLQARGGLGVEDQFALAGMQARGGLTPQQMQALAGLQARGGLTPQQRYEEQRLAMMPSLLQMSPQSLGGFAEVFGGGATGKEALQGYLSPFFAQPQFAAQGAAPAVDWGAEQPLPRPGSMAPGQQPYMEDMQGYEQISANRGAPMAASGVTANVAGSSVPTQQPPVTRQTLGGYGKDTPFARGGTQAKAAIAGKELDDYLGEVTPLGVSTRRGGFGSSVSNRSTY